MGKLIVIEGTDGSGKSTQFRLLTQRLENENIAFQKIVFPQYSEPSSALIRMYLGGEFGTNPSDVNAYAASSFYAIDRYASYKKIWGQWYEQGGLVICDRYTTSNAVHQASKEPEDRRQEFLKWLYDFEYDRLGLPRPDLTLYLDVPTDLRSSCCATGSRTPTPPRTFTSGTVPTSPPAAVPDAPPPNITDGRSFPARKTGKCGVLRTFTKKFTAMRRHVWRTEYGLHVAWNRL